MPAPGKAPSKIRFALLVMLFVYPIVTGLLYLSVAIAPVMALWYRTLHIVPLVVIAMVWGVIPFINGRLRRLLYYGSTFS